MTFDALHIDMQLVVGVSRYHNFYALDLDKTATIFRIVFCITIFWMYNWQQVSMEVVRCRR